MSTTTTEPTFAITPELQQRLREAVGSLADLMELPDAEVRNFKRQAIPESLTSSDEPSYVPWIDRAEELYKSKRAISSAPFRRAAELLREIFMDIELARMEHVWRQNQAH
jgi:hypothetical protein